MLKHEADKAARSSGVVVAGMIPAAAEALGVTQEEQNFFWPTVMISNRGHEHDLTLTMLFVMGKINGRKMSIVFSTDGDNDIVIPVE